MARITVEDCIDKFDSRFELVLVASNRARKLHSGDSPTVEKKNDKNTVIALREIADETIKIETLKDKLVEEYQTISPLDEEELSLEYSESETELNDENSDQQILAPETDIFSKNTEEELDNNNNFVIDSDNTENSL